MRTAYLWTGAASPACQRVARLQPTTDSLPRWSDTLVPVRMRRTLKTFLPLLLLFASAISLRGEQEDEPVANPGRPTVSTPAKITPVGYLQLETGVLAATHSLRILLAIQPQRGNQVLGGDPTGTHRCFGAARSLSRGRSRCERQRGDFLRRPSNSFQRRGSAADSCRQLLSSCLRRRRSGTGSWQPAKLLGASG